MAQQQKKQNRPKQPQDPYAQRTKQLTSAVQRLRGWVGSDPSRTPELADALVELTAHRLFGHSYQAAAPEAQESVKLAAQLLTANGPIGPYTAVADASRYVTAVVHLGVIQSAAGLPEAGAETVASLAELRAELGSLPLVEALAPATSILALSCTARGALVSGDLHQANAYADAARERLAASGLRAEPDAAYVVVDTDRLISDARWAAGLTEDALTHLHLARETYDRVVDGRLAQPGRLAPALLQRLTEPLFGLYRDLADRLLEVGEVDLGLVTRRQLVELLRGLAAKDDTARVQLAASLGDLVRDLQATGRAEEADLAAEELAEVPEPDRRAASELPGGIARGGGGLRWEPLDGFEAFAGAAGVTGADEIEAELQRETAARLAAEREQARVLERERHEEARIAAERREAERVEAERLAAERAEAERIEAERLAAEEEAERQERKRRREERIEAHRLEQERLAAERAEAERLAYEEREAKRRAADPAEQERLELERLQAEIAELEWAEAAAEAERVEAERVEAERLEAERLEAERVETERRAAADEAARIETERLERELRAEERAEQERAKAEEWAARRREEVRLEAERAEAARAEAARIEAERAEQARRAAERRAAEEEAARLEADRIEAERLERERAEDERRAAEDELVRLELERIETERLEREHLERERLERERAEAEWYEGERRAREEAERARLEAERVEAERVEAERQEAELAEPAREVEESAEAVATPAEQAEPVTPEPEPMVHEPAERAAAPEVDELDAAYRDWQEAKGRGDRKTARALNERVVELLRPRAEQDLAEYGPRLLYALEELSSARLRSGELFASRAPAKEAKALAKSLGRR